MEDSMTQQSVEIVDKVKKEIKASRNNERASIQPFVIRSKAKGNGTEGDNIEDNNRLIVLNSLFPPTSREKARGILFSKSK